MARRRIEIHGHRGSRGTHPENTLKGFEEALASGADYFELDTQFSADGEPVVFHDPVISSRVCFGVFDEIPVRTLTARELAAYDVGCVAQRNFPEQQLAPGAHIATLDEVLAWLVKASPEFRVNIEMKVEATSPDLMPDVPKYTHRVLELVKKHGLGDRTLLQSFDFEPLKIAREAEPSLRLSCLFDVRTDYVKEALEVGANVIGPHFSFVTPKVVRSARDAGLQVIPWTVNEPKDWITLLAMGVDGLITDYPRELAHFLDR